MVPTPSPLRAPTRVGLDHHALVRWASHLQKTEVRAERVLYWQHGGALGVSRAVASPCVRRAQEARLQSLAMQLAESDCTLRVT